MKSEKLKAFIAHIKPIVKRHRTGLHLWAGIVPPLKKQKGGRPDCLVCGQRIGSTTCTMPH